MKKSMEGLSRDSKFCIVDLHFDRFPQNDLDDLERRQSNQKFVRGREGDCVASFGPTVGGLVPCLPQERSSREA
jgi:hypothetical protein